MGRLTTTTTLRLVAALVLASLCRASPTPAPAALNVTGGGGGSLPWSYYDDLRASLPAGGSGADRRADVATVEAVDPSSGETRKYDLRHFAAMISLDDGDDDSDKPININEAASALLALNHLNEGVGDVIPEIAEVSKWCDIKFTMEFFDTRQSPIVASRAYINDIRTRKNWGAEEGNDGGESGDGVEHPARRRPYPTALIGASRSAVSAPLAILSGVHHLPQVSFASTSTVFNNKDQFPLFGRLVPSAYGDANAAISYLFRRLGVTHLGVLFVRDEYGSTYAQMLQDAAKNSEQISSSSPSAGSPPPVTIGALSSFAFDATPAEISAAVRRLADSGLRYFFGVIFGVHASAVLSEAHRQGIVGPGYHWIFGDGMSSAPTFDAETEGDLIEALEGAALLTISRPSTREGRTEFEAFAKHWSDLINSEEGRAYVLSKLPWNKERDSDGGGDLPAPPDRKLELQEESGPFELLEYDAVIALGMAACDATREGKYFDGKAFYRSFLRTEFNGLYGSVVIDPKTGSRMYSSVPYSVSNYIAGPPDENGVVTVKASATDVQEQGNRPSAAESADDNGDGSHPDKGTNSSDGNGGGVWWKSIKPFVFSDGTTDPPPVLPDLTETVDIVDSGAQIFGYVLSGIGLALSVLFGLWTFIHRENVIVLSSQPLFLCMLVIGALLISLAIIPMSMQEEISQRRGGEAACMLTPWLFSFGFIVGFSGLFSKMTMVNEIYRSRGQRRRVAVKPRDVLKPFVFLFVANLAVLISWTVISPLTYRYIMTGSVDKFGRSNKFYGTCTPANAGNDDRTFAVLWGAINLSALLYANYQAYKARYIITEYGESFYVGLSMAILLQAVIIGTPVMLVVDDSPTATFVVRCCLLFITALGLVLPIFVPKLIFFHRWRAHEKKLERQLILSLKKERQMDALAIGDISASSWYLQRMEGSRIESIVTTDDGDIGVRIIATGKGASRQERSEISQQEGEVCDRSVDDDAPVGNRIIRRFSVEDRAQIERMYKRASSK